MTQKWSVIRSILCVDQCAILALPAKYGLSQTSSYIGGPGSRSVRAVTEEGCETHLPAAGLWQNGELLLLWEAKRTASCKKAHEERAQHVRGQVRKIGAKAPVVNTCISQIPFRIWTPWYSSPSPWRLECAWLHAVVPICVCKRNVERAAPSEVRQTPHEPLQPSEKKRSTYIRVSTPSWLQNARWTRTTVSSLALSGFMLCFNRAFLDVGATAAHPGRVAKLHADYIAFDTSNLSNNGRSFQQYLRHARIIPLASCHSAHCDLPAIKTHNAECRLQVQHQMASQLWPVP